MIRKFIFAAAALVGMAAGAQSPREWKECASGDMSFIVANDLGRNGYYEQKPIAALMGDVAEAIGPDAVLALGDTHHYQGVQSVSDPLWMTNFELIYSHPELQVDWYPVCGNHEYRGNTQAVLDYSTVSRRWEMPARYYSKIFEDNGTSLRIVFIDTTPLIDKYRKKIDTYPDAHTQDMEAQLRWLDQTLSEAKEDWVVVAGHHPVYAATDKPESERTDMQKRVDSILRKHNVNMYICGHIHNFQHIQKPDSPVCYVVNSAGSLSRPAPDGEPGMQFSSADAGFSILDVDKEALSLSMIDGKGRVIHRIRLTH